MKKVKRSQKIERIREKTALREKELALKKAEKRLKKGTLHAKKKGILSTRSR